MKRLTLILALAVAGAFTMERDGWAAETAGKANVAPQAESPLDQDMKTLDGQDVNLAEKYAGQVVLLVNVASRCGFTPQYEALQALHEQHAGQGLAVVGLPCNQFKGQEPGTADEIAEFCRTNYGVEFDMLAKAEVNGDNACPLYQQITSQDTQPQPAGPISWNFEKFLFARDGRLVARFAPQVEPDSPEVTRAIEAELAKP